MIRILIVDKPRLYCHSMRAVLQKERDMNVVACATNVEEAMVHVPHSNVVLVSTTLENEDILKLVQNICSHYPKIKVLVVGVSEVTEVILGYVEAGVAGYILQEESVEQLIQKIRAAYRGEALVSPRIAARLISRLAELANLQSSLEVHPQSKLRRFADLTPREQEVLSLIGQGYSNQKIADHLIIECGTVKNHVHNILRKLNASNRQEAAAVYMINVRNNGSGLYAQVH